MYRNLLFNFLIDNNILNFHIFLDRSTLEVFANDYQISGTARFYIDKVNTDMNISDDNADKIQSMEIWKLHSCW